MEQPGTISAAPGDHFAALCLELDEAAAALSPENVQRSYADPKVDAACRVRVLVENRRGLVLQDRITRLERDRRRRNAVRELIEQGQKPEDAESNITIFAGPPHRSPVPDPAAIQPTPEQAAVLRAGIDRVLELAGLAGNGEAAEPDETEPAAESPSRVQPNALAAELLRRVQPGASAAETLLGGSSGSDAVTGVDIN